jgi:crotonobetainyl-CoA:carnitine CoA-transferase CaiB-like acyl-CoA transferase
MNEKRLGALEGIRVLDLTRVLAGPFATMMMADMGAEVIKIEIPGKGDDSRAFGPFMNGQSLYYMNLNRNKKGVTLDLKKDEGKEIFLEMVKVSDVVVENYRPGTMEKLGLGYEVLKDVNPGIVYAAVSGFGHYGPYMKRPGYDIIGQAMGGLMSTTGWPGGEPTRTGTAMGDVLGGLSVTIGILAALKNRDFTGKGQKVDVSLVDSVVASMEIITQIYLAEGRLPERIGNRYETVYPYDSFKAKDGSLVIGAGNEKLYQMLCQLMGMPHLASDDRFNTIPKRNQRHVELKAIIEEWCADKTVEELVDMLLAAGVPAAPIYNVAQVVKDPHIAKAREMFVDVKHPKAGDTTLTGCHIKLYDTKPCIRRPAPLLGQHNQQVYSELLGMSDEGLEQLKAKGVI